MSKPSFELKTGVGDPSSPYFGQLLSEEDEKRLDPSGNVVVSGKLWSKAYTGVYLTCYVTTLVPTQWGSEILKGWGDTYKVGATYLNVLVSEGKPRPTIEGWGASLELPEDVSSDPLKGGYVGKWFAETLKEALESAGEEALAATPTQVMEIIGEVNKGLKVVGL